MEGVLGIKRNAKVLNPKDRVADSLINLRKLPALLKQTERDINVLNSWESASTTKDVVNSAMLLVFIIVAVTNAIDEVSNIGEELKEVDRKFIISLIVIAVLFIIEW
jgi:hypothetical protein